jgi:ParB family chromosome partitioning protein
MTAQRSKGLGKGLGAIFSSSKNFSRPIQKTAKEIEDNISTGEIKYIPINRITANTFQPRQAFDEEELQSLSDSIKKHGVLQTLLLSPDGDDYQLIAGERRWRASKMAGLDKVPAIIKTVGDLEKLELALIENIQRQDLNPIEKAVSYKQLIENFDLTQEEAAKRLATNRSSLANTLRLLNLPVEMQKAISAKKISEGQARTLLSLENLPDQQEDLFQQLLQHKLPVRKAEEIVKQIKGRKKMTALPDFNVQDRIDRLQKVLQSKVDIKWSGKKGKITIDIFDLDEVDEIISKLK